MIRILADLPDDDVRWLDARAAVLGKSRAALIREAIAALRARDRDWLEQGFGLWTRYGCGEDGARFSEAAAQGWDREGGAA